MASQLPKDINHHPTTIRIKRLKDFLTHVSDFNILNHHPERRWFDKGFSLSGGWTLTQPDIGTKGALVEAVVFCYLETLPNVGRFDSGVVTHCWTQEGFGSHTGPQKLRQQFVFHSLNVFLGS